MPHAGRARPRHTEGVTMPKLTNAQLAAIVADLSAKLAAMPSSPVGASAHWKARDIACNAAKPCGDTFRTAKGRDWHAANIKH